MKKSPTYEVVNELSERYADRYVTNKIFRLSIDASYPLSIPRSIGMDILVRVNSRLYRAGAKRVLGDYMMKLLQASSSQLMETVEKETKEQENRIKEASRELKGQEGHEKATLSHNEHQKRTVEKYLQTQIENLERGKNQELDTGREEYRRRAREDFKKEFTQSLERGRLLENASTGLRYDPDALVSRLSELFLDDILEKSGQDVREGYRALYAGSAGVEFIGRGAIRPDIPLRGADWVATKRASMEAGREHIEETDIIVRYPESEQLIKSAIIMDASGSMIYPPQKLQIAKQTALALGKMIERQNKDNDIVYIVFAGDNKVVSAAELYTSGVHSSTNIGGGLERAYRVLESGPPRIGIVYLVSDCRIREGGFTLESVWEAANLYRNNDNYHLRVFLLDSDEETKGDAIEMGKRSGKNSRIAPVNWENLDIVAIEDLVHLFTGFYRPEEIR